ncbi:MAG: nitrite/sulfite reductase [Proteobacteria bacterium]|jgi:sulfite reductase (NADPH) hemoprotein beta-component|nr:nitrite/sulfite reductase [Pseudomonadota bacterium]
MYQYDGYDQAIVDQRVSDFRDQTARFLAGQLSDQEYQPLRLQNGLYIQRYAPMLRIAVPYGMLSSRQLRSLAAITRDFDRGYAHVSTRQNLQINWPELERVPDILAELAKVEMHAIQTSGNCIRNITTDQFAGVAKGESLDPRPYCEILRQWSTLHPEFAFLPRKFKIAVSANQTDRAVILAHDIGIELDTDSTHGVTATVYVGGGLGRTPMIGSLLKERLPIQQLISYLEATLRVYNQFGRRDNKYKARIKILVKAMGISAFADKVEAQWAVTQQSPTDITAAEIERVSQFFSEPNYLDPQRIDAESLPAAMARNRLFARWVTNNTAEHRRPGYRIVTVALKSAGQAPGDVTHQQLDALALLADQFSFGEVRTTHQQNIVLADVQEDELAALWHRLQEYQLAAPTAGTLHDMICCPGGDFCSLANAKSIPIANAIQDRFDDLDYVCDLGPIELNISGCMNACGHHHVGHIGILGVDKKGREFYQIALGGRQGKEAAIGKILGPSFSQEAIADVVETILNTYVTHRIEPETFIDTYDRIGIETFKEAVYASAH